MGEDAWLEAAYEDACAGFVGHSEDEWDDEPVQCSACGEEILGAIWNGGRCLDCHEAGLLPETAWDRREAAYAD
jgi:hypothetical protein